MEVTVGPRRLEPRTPEPKRQKQSTPSPAVTDVEDESLSYIIDLLHVGQTDLAVRTFGKEQIEKWKAAGYKVRDIWELSSTSTQCTNTVGKVDETTECWLCGIKLSETKALTPNCEHVLPIAQAVMVLDLYKAAMKPDKDSPFFKLEYAWSHDICNQIKDDEVFFKQDSLEVDTDAIGRLLTSIRKSNRKGIETLTSNFPPGWEKTRVPLIAKKFQDIIEFMKGPISQSGGLYYLAMVAGASDVRGLPAEQRELLIGEIAKIVRKIRDIEKIKFEEFSSKLIGVPEKLAAIVLDKLVGPRYGGPYVNFLNKFFNIRGEADLHNPSVIASQVSSIVVDNFYPIYERVYQTDPSKAEPVLIQVIIAKICIKMKKDLTEYYKENQTRHDRRLMDDIDNTIRSSLATIPEDLKPEIESAVHQAGGYRRRPLPKLV